MAKINYSDSFYVNNFPNKGEAYAKNYIETFMKKPPKKLFDYLEEQNHFGKVNPEFQAVIIGEPRSSLFGVSQAAVLIVNSNFIAYTTTSDYATPVAIPYGYATFDNKLSVTKAENDLELHSPNETFQFGVGSESLEEDYETLLALFEKNVHSIELSHEVLPESSDDKKDSEMASLEAQQPDTEPFVVPVPSEAYDEVPVDLETEQPTEEEILFPVAEDENLAEDEELISQKEEETEQEWGHILMKENAQGEMEEMKHLPAERADQLPVETSRSERTKRERASEGSGRDRRFQTERPIISNDRIPHGFVYYEPVVYVNSVRPGVFKTLTARAGYTKAYEACLDEIKGEIATGKFDAVFNLRFTAQSVENYFDVVVTGDAAVFDKE